MEHDRIPELIEKLSALVVVHVRAQVACQAAGEAATKAHAAELFAEKDRKDAEKELREEIERRATAGLIFKRDSDGPRIYDSPRESC